MARLPAAWLRGHHSRVLCEVGRHAVPLYLVHQHALLAADGHALLSIVPGRPALSALVLVPAFGAAVVAAQDAADRVFAAAFPPRPLLVGSHVIAYAHAVAVAPIPTGHVIGLVYRCAGRHGGPPAPGRSTAAVGRARVDPARDGGCRVLAVMDRTVVGARPPIPLFETTLLTC
jgi:hypothetical protein